jgi:hypothetical protein
MAPERKATLRNKAKPIAKGNGLIALRYEDSIAAKPPIPVTVAPPRAPPVDTHPALRTSNRQHENKRDSGLAPTTTTTSSKAAREGSPNSASVKENVLGFTINFNSSSLPIALSESAQTTSPPRTPTNPNIVKKSYSMSGSRWRRPSSKGSRTSGAAPKTPTSAGKDAEEQFSPITTAIPTDSLLDADFLNSLSFSKRGSIMLGGKKAVNGHSRPYGGRRWVHSGYFIQNVANGHGRQPSFSMLASPAIRVLSDDLEKESQKVRSMYEQGTNFDWQDGKYSGNAELNIQEENASEETLPAR